MGSVVLTVLLFMVYLRTGYTEQLRWARLYLVPALYVVLVIVYIALPR